MDNLFINFLNKLKQQKKINFQLSLQKKRFLNRTKIINFAYDLQTGSYIRDWEKKRQRYSEFINEIINAIYINISNNIYRNIFLLSQFINFFNKFIFIDK